MNTKKERMTSKERVVATLNYQKTDRVPINYHSNPALDERLKIHFGLDKEDDEGLKKALGVDFRGIGVPYIGPRLHAEVEDRAIDQEWGYHLRWVEHGSGGYWDFCDFPLKNATAEEVAAWPMPSADDYDYSGLEAQCEAYKDYGLYVGDAGLACIMNTAGFFRSMDQMFMDLALDDPAGLLLIDRFLDLQFERMVRILQKVGHLVDFMWIGEDLGTQIAPIISEAMFHKHILPRQQRFIDLAKVYNLPVMIHTCGSSSWSYEAYIKAGVNAVDTLQPEATNMSPEYLTEHFGGRLAFHGGISTTGVLSFGTVDEVIDDVKRTLEIFMACGGYCFSPTHSLQDNTPTENVLAMYETGHEFGWYE